MSKYTIGDKVKVSNRLTHRGYNSKSKNPDSYYTVSYEQLKLKDTILTISNIDGEGDYLVEENRFEWTDEMLVDVKDSNEDDLVRYVVYDAETESKSDVVETEEEMKRTLKRCSQNRGHNGKLIGYQMIPLYQAEEVTTLNLFKRTKITKQ